MKDKGGILICCMNCIYSEWLDGQEGHLDSKMFCHRYAPQKIHGIGTGCDVDKWPLMGMKDWCGDFQSKIPPG